jgi:hypothetical protein
MRSETCFSTAKLGVAIGLCLAVVVGTYCYKEWKRSCQVAEALDPPEAYAPEHGVDLDVPVGSHVEITFPSSDEEVPTTQRILIEQTALIREIGEGVDEVNTNLDEIVRILEEGQNVSQEPPPELPQ